MMSALYDWQSLAPVTFGKMISDNDPEYPQSTMEVRLNGHVVGWITQLTNVTPHPVRVKRSMGITLIWT